MYIGVDTHKKTHVLVAIDARGQMHGTQTWRTLRRDG